MVFLTLSVSQVRGLIFCVMFFSPWLVLSYIFSRRPCGSILKLAATVFEETPELLDDEVLKIFLFSIDSGERSMFLLRTE
jgi:hypothetical protein